MVGTIISRHGFIVRLNERGVIIPGAVAVTVTTLEVSINNEGVPERTILFPKIARDIPAGIDDETMEVGVGIQPTLISFDFLYCRIAEAFDPATVVPLTFENRILAGDT